MSNLKSNLLVFAGPFLGEFGWELSHWVPHVRWLKRKHYAANHVIVASYPGRQALYYGIVDEFWPLPDWFTEKKYDCDCFEALCPHEDYARILKHFRDLYKNQFSEIIETRTPRGFNKVIRENNQVLFEKLKSSKTADETCQAMIEQYGNKPTILIFAREVYRKMFLDIKLNRPVSCDVLKTPLPSRNWPQSHWIKLFDMLYNKYKDQVTFAIDGTAGGNCLLEKAQVDDVINLCEANSLDTTIAFLNHAMLSISSQGGSTHLALQCGCPSFIYGHEEKRHAVDDNPLKTEVTFFATDINHYADSPQALYRDICIAIDELLERKTVTSDQWPVINEKKSEMDDNLVYWDQRYKIMAKENVVGHRAWTDEQYKTELNIWSSKLQPFLNYIKVNRELGTVNREPKVLDFGCGIGRFMPLLSKHSDKYFGCDILEAPIREARKIIIDIQRLAVINKHQIPFDNTNFDLIFSCVVLQHVIDQNLLNHYINQFYERLNSHGHVLIVENISSAPSNNYLAFRSREKYIEMFKTGGFELIKADIFESSNEPHAILLFGKKQKEIKKVGIVGVFDVSGSTSIPFGRVFEKLGCEVKELNYRTIAASEGMGQLEFAIIATSLEMDMMIFSKCNGISDKIIEEASNNCITVFHMVDAISHLQGPEYYRKAQACHFSIVTTRAMKDALEVGGVTKPIYHIIQGIDPEEFYPVIADKKYDVVFIGTQSEKRDRILSKLIDWKYSVKAYGHGYDRVVKGEVFNRACCEGRICLAINNTDANIDSFSDRMLRYMATKSCVLAEYSEGLEHYFENGEHLVWFRETDDVRQVIYILLKIENRRKRIAQSGYEKVIEQYTWDKVTKEIIQIALNLNQGEAENVG